MYSTKAEDNFLHVLLLDIRIHYFVPLSLRNSLGGSVVSRQL